MHSFHFLVSAATRSGVSLQEHVQIELGKGTTQSRHMTTIKQISPWQHMASSHLFLFQHVCFAKDFHGIHVTRVLLLNQAHLKG